MSAYRPVGFECRRQLGGWRGWGRVGGVGGREIKLGASVFVCVCVCGTDTVWMMQGIARFACV